MTQTDAIHYFDLFALPAGPAATAVTATLRDHLGRGLDDCSFATVEYGDVPAFVEAGYFAPGTQRECVIVGERGDTGRRLRQLGGAAIRNRACAGRRGGWQARGGRRRDVKASGPEPLSRELERSWMRADGPSPVPVDVEAGSEALRVVEAAQRSSRTGRRVTLSEIG